MPSSTYELIQSVSLSSSTTDVTLNSIPQGFSDLVLVMSGACVNTISAAIFGQFNANTSSVYNYVYMQSNGQSTTALETQSTDKMFLGRTRNDISACSSITDFIDYSATNKNTTSQTKSGFWEGSNNGADRIEIIGGRYANNAAITSIRLYLSAGDFASGFTFDLYGIAG